MQFKISICTNFMNKSNKKNKTSNDDQIKLLNKNEVNKIINSQDNALNDLAKLLDTQLSTAKIINLELKEQNTMLDDFGGDVDLSIDKIDRTNGMLNKILKKSDSNCTYWVIFILLIILIILIFLIIWI